MLQVRDEKIPLREVEGTVYVGETRVTMDCVVEMFDRGASPEEIAIEYDSLCLPDIYAVITYYLRNRHAVAAVLARQARESDEARRVCDGVFPRQLREKLLREKSRREEQGSGGQVSA
jgi:uncharacterized protein (DUF433 family)